jgi:hypothetical protein
MVRSTVRASCNSLTSSSKATSRRANLVRAHLFDGRCNRHRILTLLVDVCCFNIAKAPRSQIIEAETDSSGTATYARSEDLSQRARNTDSPAARHTGAFPLPELRFDTLDLLQFNGTLVTFAFLMNPL